MWIVSYYVSQDGELSYSVFHTSQTYVQLRNLFKKLSTATKLAALLNSLPLGHSVDALYQGGWAR